MIALAAALMSLMPVGVPQAQGCPEGTTGRSGDVEVLDCLFVAPEDVAGVRAYLEAVALERQGLVLVDGELVPWTFDLHNWLLLAECESGRRWHIHGTYSGGLQFLDGTWRAMGGVGRAGDAPAAEQIERARELEARAGWGQWPACTRRLGYR
jgi:hypothetical protein